MNLDKLREFEPIFYPRSIAVVGASTDEKKAGTGFLRALLDTNFKGEVYAVNPSGETILGLKSYPKVSSIPDPVDYVIVSVPAGRVLTILDDCAAKGVKAVHFFTAGFTESGIDENRRLENEMVRKARSGGFHIIGPNCIGVSNPSINMPYGLTGLRGQPGSVSFLSQSGGVGGNVMDIGIARGIHFSKVVSFGNGCDLDGVDYLEYFAADPETKFIGAYLEGTRDGERLFSVLKEVSRTKPVVVWKGGRTGRGVKAATSHTGSLTSSYTVWNTALKQAGVVEVKSFTEFVDTLLAFQQISHFEGENVAIVSGFTDGGGGDGVTATDSCISLGMNVPEFSDQTIVQLKSILPFAGSIFHNPLDVSQAWGNPDTIRKSLNLAAADPNIDFLLVFEHMDQFILYLSADQSEAINESLIDLKQRSTKPVVMVLPPQQAEVERTAVEKRFSDAGMLTYPSPEQAAKALMNVSRYFRAHSGDKLSER